MPAWLFTEEFYLARLVIQRGLALIYSIGFLVTINQFKGLIGSNGLLPVPRFLTYVKFWQAPSIFHFHYSDSFFALISWIGLIVSIALVLGLADKLPWWGSALIWFIPWLLYLSIMNVGQTFYGFGWESLLLEIGFLAIFLGSSKTLVPIVIIFLLRLILFKLEFGAGLIKMRGDECWRDLTCLDYHHETQPMPNPLSWHFHNLPTWIHRCEVAGNHFFQLIVPWGLFLPQPLPTIAASLIIGSQSWLVLSGNFSWLNWSAILLAVSGLSNNFLRRLIPIEIPASLISPTSYQMTSLIISLLILVLSYKPIMNMISPGQKMNASFDPLHLVNTYGAFGSVTKKRFEIVIEGSNDQKTWQEYQFKGKPGDPKAMPAQYAPYHLRLDWLMWFAAFGREQQSHLFIPLIEKLLPANQDVLKLLKYNPFPEQAPKFIRAKYYLYTFTSPQERKETGAYWNRELVGDYIKTVSLK